MYCDTGHACQDHGWGVLDFFNAGKRVCKMLKDLNANLSKEPFLETRRCSIVWEKGKSTLYFTLLFVNPSNPSNERNRLVWNLNSKTTISQHMRSEAGYGTNTDAYIPEFMQWYEYSQVVISLFLLVCTDEENINDMQVENNGYYVHGTVPWLAACLCITRFGVEMRK